MAITRLGGATAITGTIPTSVAPGAGKVLQVVQTIKTDTFSSTANGFFDLTGLSLAITPSATSSKILVIPDVAMASSDFYSYNFVWRALRTSTVIGVSTTASSTNASGGANLYLGGGQYPYLFGNSKMILDSPSTTSATTYKIQASKISAGGTLYLNRKGVDNGTGGISSLTLMEVSA